MLSWLLSAAAGLLVTFYLLLPSTRTVIDHKTESIRLILPYSPNHLTTLEIWRLVFSALLKHLPAITGQPTTLKASSQSFDLPRIEVAGQLDITSSDLKAFKEAVAQNGASVERDPINPLCLVALTVPLTIQILASDVCPIRPLGAVNTRNSFTIHDPRLCRNAYKLQTSKLCYRAVFGGKDLPGLRRKRGIEFCIQIDITCEGRLVVSQESWYLQMLPASQKPLYTESSSGESESSVRHSKVQVGKNLLMTSNEPKKWAKCSKDYNPIHVFPLGAKLFGFQSVIAHGNHVAALVLQHLVEITAAARTESTMEVARDTFWVSNEPFVLQVSFRRPLILPAEANVHWTAVNERDKVVNFEVVARAKVAVQGVLRPLSTADEGVEAKGYGTL